MDAEGVEDGDDEPIEENQAGESETDEEAKTE